MGIVANPACATMPATFFEMLAACVMKDPITGATFLNVMCSDFSCDEFAPALECGDNVDNPEAFIVANAFTVDNCGYPALRLRLCETDSEPQ